MLESNFFSNGKLFLCILFISSLLAAGCRKTNGTVTPSPTTVVIVDENSPTRKNPLPSITPRLTAMLTTTLTLMPTPTLMPSATPTLTPTPTNTPTLLERIPLAATAIFYGEYNKAIEQLSLINQEMPSAETTAQLAISHYENGEYDEVISLISRLSEEERQMTDGYFFMGKAFLAQGDCPNAEGSFNSFLNDNPDLGAYLYPLIAECRDSAEMKIFTYEQAVAAPAHYFVRYLNRFALAQLYMEKEEYQKATDLYLLMNKDARTKYTQAEMLYSVGNAKILAGDLQGYDDYQNVVKNYPEQPAAYQGLLQLVDKEYAVDFYQRGVIDYNAKAYAPCIVALEEYLKLPEVPFSADAMIYLAWCQEGMGQVTEGLATLDQYIGLGPAYYMRGMNEKGDLLRRQGGYDEALEAYNTLIAAQPYDKESAEASWRAALLADYELNRPNEAIRHYLLLEKYHDWYEKTPAALLRLGIIYDHLGKKEEATTTWRKVATKFSNTDEGLAALVWLLRLNPDDPELRPLAEELPELPLYYSIRLHDELVGQEPFAPVKLDLNNARVQNQAEAETWLRAKIELADEVDVATLSAKIAQSDAFLRAQHLWKLRLFQEAKREFELIREENGDDLLVTYQLALYYREIGLYGSSIKAAQTIINATDETPFSVPPFIAGLSYPVYYADLIESLAKEYDYDPLVQFSLVRQESLYESFVSSTAAAQGLAQVIPDTGEYIAMKLGWTGYTNDDLYKPFVGLRFGGYYLTEQLKRFDGTIHAALAAYNGGPGNAQRWYDSAEKQIDAYVEQVNFPETRLYIERIYVGHAVYRYLYGAD